MPAGASLTPGLLHAAGHRKRAQSRASVAARTREPRGAFGQDLRNPIQGFEVVFQRWTAEQAHLRHVGRPQARHAALAFNRLNHCRFFAADIGAGAAPQVDARRASVQAPQLSLQQATALMVLIAQVHVNVVNANCPGGDQHPFKELPRIAFEVEAVFEGARLAFIDIDGHQAQPRLVAHDAPLAPRRESGTTQPAQARAFQLRDHCLHGARAGQAFIQHRKFAGLRHPARLSAWRRAHWRRGSVIWRQLASARSSGNSRHHAIATGRPNRLLSHQHGRRLVAAPDTGSSHHPHLPPQQRRQTRQQFASAGHLARQAIAHAHGQCRRRRFALADDIEMVVEGGDFKDFNLGQAQFGG